MSQPSPRVGTSGRLDDCRRVIQTPAPAKHLRQRQLAKRWDSSEQTLANWRWQRIGPPLKIGGGILYGIEDIEQYGIPNLKVNTGGDTR
jgi:hypothetical protein